MASHARNAILASGVRATATRRTPIAICARVSHMPLDDSPNSTSGRVARFANHIQAFAGNYEINAWLLAGLIAAESAGNPYAIRVERGWLKRYWRGSVAAVRATTGRQDDRWLKYPDLASTSYGLMQVLFIVAVERGVPLDYPTELCDPQLNLLAGCNHLAWLRDRFGTSPTRMLLRYNGGGNPNYPGIVDHHARVLHAHRDSAPLREAIGSFTPWR